MPSNSEYEVIKPWERQPEEGKEAFDAFDVYAKIGTNRSIARAAAEVGNSSGGQGKDKSLLERWSSKHKWIARAASWDRHVARLENERHLMGRAEMRGRQIRDAQRLQGQVAKRIDSMTDSEISKLKPSEMVMMLRAAAEIERNARAVPQDEQNLSEREDAPTFIINFIPQRPAGMVSVRLATGEAGYIPEHRVDEFLADYPGAVAIR
jgi:hypothetical protein